MKNPKKEPLISVLNPILNYLLSIENNPGDDNFNGFLTYNLGVPKNWIMKGNNLNCEIIKSNEQLNLIRITPYDNDTEDTIDSFYNKIILLIEKNIELDKKRIELDEEIEKLKSKFEDEQKQLLDEFYLTNDNINGNEEEIN